ncbi:bifunctional homocysteine S-methyltransferase/5,10-methylenetetrahydrofolate reductase [Geobacter sp. OR-1]|uniref:methylenetetrahydrofolate reductase n=1 Tax=Geobacter sp. OR-1 TaxID=1266765 RepID=UPI000543B653|nr:methylenetetrahydrofolate reductase [Geobacter sp. OR-1]GAM10631.1 bifunctional homocysteine S-methyltransferase/5,10-methylenetetrahydrofolate reductase [Geobacter sp. OR-1]
MPSPLQAKLAADSFVITAEVCPPKGSDCAQFLNVSRALSDQVDAINITDNQGANMRISSLAASALLIRDGIEPIFQLTCRDRNRLALQSDLLGAAALGVTNILALTGDYISFGDHPQGKPVFDLDSVQLLRTIDGLNNGKDMNGHQLSGSTTFFCGAAAAPDAEPFELSLIKLEKKVAAGARFFQTQAIFDLKKLERFKKATRHLQVKTIAGILLLKSAGMARYINKHIPGLTIPDIIIDQLAGAPDPAMKGLEIACRLAVEAAPLCDGIHIMAMGREELIPNIVETLKR